MNFRLTAKTRAAVLVSALAICLSAGACGPTSTDRCTAPSEPVADWLLARAGIAGHGNAPATYYVAQYGSDEHDGRTMDTAFRTISRAAEVVTPGDVVQINGGEYEEQPELVVSGDREAPIVFEAVAGQEVVIDANGTSHEDGEWALLIDGDWNVVRGLTVRNSASYGVRVKGSKNVLIGVVSHDNRHHGFSVWGQENELRNAVSYANRQPACGWLEDEGQCQQSADGFHVAGEDNGCYGCVAFKNADDGFDGWDGTGAVFASSVAFANGYDEGNGNGFKLSQLDAGRTTVHHSIAFDNKRRGFTNNGGGGHHMYNNTAYGNGRVGFQNYENENVLENNIAFGQEHDYETWGEPPVESNNSWNLGIVDPGFVCTDYQSRNFLMLAEGSPAIDAGVTVGGSHESPTPDLGALEHGTGIVELLARSHRMEARGMPGSDERGSGTPNAAYATDDRSPRGCSVE